MADTKQPHVFLCHASEDKPAVRRLYERLVNDGIDAWLDEEKLLPGQNWQLEIPKAVRNSDAIIVFLSTQSVKKAGFVQKEIKLALDVAQEKPEGAIYFIPARLDECVVPDSLREYQWVNLFEEKGYEKIKRVLQTRINPEIEKPVVSDKDTTPTQVAIPHATEINIEGQKPSSRQGNHLRKLRAIHTERLRILELQSAKFGLSVPPHILLEIEEIREKISQIDSQLQEALPSTYQGSDKKT
jgi:TIR domain